MKEKKTHGTWALRAFIHVVTLLLGLLIFWLLGFVLEDIGSIPGPNFAEIERRHVDPTLVSKQQQMTKQLADLEQEIANNQEQQRLIGDSSQNLQRTINQLVELQKLSMQKSVSLSDAEKNNLSASLTQFLSNQKNYQELHQKNSDLMAKKLRAIEDKHQVEQRTEKQREPAQIEFQELTKAHSLKLAFYQLLILVPLLLIAGYLVVRKRRSIYFPFYLALGGATLVKVGLVIHEYFPSEYFKYILILALLVVVGWFLVYLIKIVAHPKLDWLMKQYREAYERFLCPICEFPIRTGPRRFLYWTRRTVHKVLPPAGFAGKEEAYTCPSCGTALFEICPSCQNVRYSLLPNCEHCGAEKSDVPKEG